MKIKILMIFIAMFLVGCSYGTIEPRDTVHVSSKFDAETIELILVGAKVWNYATNEAVSLKMIVSDDADAHVIKPMNLSKEEVGRTTRSTLTPYVEIGLDLKHMKKDRDVQIIATTMHELMHGFGFEEHLSRGLMSEIDYYASNGPCVDELTLKHYCAMNECPTGSKPACVLVQQSTENH